MSMQARNPFHARLARIEQELLDPRPLDRLGTVTGKGLGEVTAKLDKVAQGTAQTALEAQLRQLVLAQEGTATALKQIVTNTDPGSSARLSLGVALLLLLVDRNGTWDGRYDVGGMLADKFGERLDALDGSRGGKARSKFIREAPALLGSGGKSADQLFGRVTRRDAEQFCELVPLLLDALAQADGGDPNPAAPAARRAIEDMSNVATVERPVPLDAPYPEEPKG